MLHDDVPQVFDTLVAEWLASMTLEEILESNDLDAESLVLLLLTEGHITPPPYLESLLEVYRA